MKYVVGVSAVLFTLLAPVISAAGVLTKLGVRGPTALVCAAVVIGVLVFWRLR